MNSSDLYRSRQGIRRTIARVGGHDDPRVRVRYAAERVYRMELVLQIPALPITEPLSRVTGNTGSVAFVRPEYAHYSHHSNGRGPE